MCVTGCNYGGSINWNAMKPPYVWDAAGVNDKIDLLTDSQRKSLAIDLSFAVLEQRRVVQAPGFTIELCLERSKSTGPIVSFETARRMREHYESANT